MATPVAASAKQSPNGERPGAFSLKNPSPPEHIRQASDAKPVVSEHLAQVERLVGANQWAGVCALLAPERDAAEQLPPSLALIYAVALKESDPTTRDADRRAIQAVANLLGIPHGSALALVLGKRLTRRRHWGETPAPSKAVSAFVLVGGLAIGGLIGWMITFWMM